jgi:polyketide cyclase/dehydrase/lipid transport protein
MSLSVQTSVDLGASPQKVWDVVMDPRRLEAWVTTHQRVSRAPVRLCAGSSFEQTLRLAGKTFDVRWTVIEASEPRYAEWAGNGPYGSRARVRYRLAPLDGNRTCFGYENEFDLPGGLLGRAASRLVGSARARREAERSLTNLKQLLEKGRRPAR